MGGVLLTGCGESPKEKVMGLIDDLEQAIRDRDVERAEEISKEFEKIDFESLSEEDHMELANREREIMGDAFFDAEPAEEPMNEFDY